MVVRREGGSVNCDGSTEGGGSVNCDGTTEGGRVSKL
jgi:hypothetical protein